MRGVHFSKNRFYGLIPRSQPRLFKNLEVIFSSEKDVGKRGKDTTKGHEGENNFYFSADKSNLFLLKDSYFVYV